MKKFMALFDRFKKKSASGGSAVGGKELPVPPLKAEAVKKKAEVKTPVKKRESRSRKIAHQVLFRPLVTEKASGLGAVNKYVFAVAPKANKITIKKAIAELYGVSPLAVNVINLRGKNVRYGRTSGQTRAWKKAIVTLRQGETIKVSEV